MIDLKSLLQYSSNLKVLYVEDDENFARETQDVLKKLFSVVDYAKDGQEALEMYKSNFAKNRYDLVITDIYMPKVDGLELTKSIYKIDPNQPIIVISAHDESKYLLEFVNIGIEHFIVKPFDISEISEVLYKVTKKINSNVSIVQLANNYSWDRNSLTLFYKAKEIKLTKKEIMFIKMLIQNGTSITKTEDILNSLWGDKMESITTDVLNPMISRLRKKLPEKLIKSIYGFGYTLYYTGSEDE